MCSHHDHSCVTSNCNMYLHQPRLTATFTCGSVAERCCSMGQGARFKAGQSNSNRKHLQSRFHGERPRRTNQGCKQGSLCYFCHSLEVLFTALALTRSNVACPHIFKHVLQPLLRDYGQDGSLYSKLNNVYSITTTHYQVY